MGGVRSEVNDGTTRVLMEAATWNGPNIQRTSTRLGLRTEASGRFEKRLSPEQALEGQALAAKLMVELCGARPVGGTIDVGGPGPSAAVIRLREARVEALLGARDPARRAGDDPRAARLRRRASADDGLDVTVPALAAQRRHPRGRPRRGGRADLGLREAADHAALAARGQRPARAARSGCGGGPRTRWSAPGSPRSSAGASPRRRSSSASASRRTTRAARVVELANPMSEDQSVLRTTLLGPLLDNVAAQPRARQRGRAAVGVRRGLPRARRPAGGRRRRRANGAASVPGLDRLPDERAAPRRAAHRPPAPADVARRRAAARRLLRRQGRARAR